MVLTREPSRALKAPAYRLGAATLFVSVAAIVSALAFEHIGGYRPCPLCLMQRWAYYAGIPLTFVALVGLSAGYARFAGLLLILVALGFLANAGIAVYHAGVEWHLWAGPDTCAGTGGTELSASAQDLLRELSTTRVVRCDEAPWEFLGLSFAGWNAVISAALFVTALRAGSRALSQAPAEPPA
jgi:disulfide bond formation protein DsbB